jgi:hypothetical protein
MRFYGRTEGADLVLKCEDPGGSCPDSTLRFKRVSTTQDPNQPVHATPDGERDRQR